MAKREKKYGVAAYEGGVLRLLDSGSSSGETVLALPLSRLLVKVIKVPAENDAIAFSTNMLQSLSPFPDDSLTVSCEKVDDCDGGEVVIAAALPESAADDIAAALDEKKLRVVGIDVLALGLLHGLWNVLDCQNKRKLLLMKSVDCVSLIALDDERPVAIRAIDESVSLRREVMLSLLEAEDFGGVGKLDEIVVIGELDASELETIAPIRRLEVGEDAALVGVEDRMSDPNTLNALPASWLEVLNETRFKAKLVRYLSIAGGIWLLIIGVLIGVPMVYDMLAQHQKTLCREHSRQYRAVKAMQDKVKIVRKYSDHAHGALEIMKAVSDRLPAGITLLNWNYKREEGIRFSGESDQAADVYDFKNRMEAMQFGEGEDAEKVFKTVRLGSLSASKNKQKFDIELGFMEPEEQ